MSESIATAEAPEASSVESAKSQESIRNQRPAKGAARRGPASGRRSNGKRGGDLVELPVKQPQLPTQNPEAIARGVSNRELHRVRGLEFMPVASHPAPLCAVKLSSEYSIKLFQDYYGRAHVALYHLMVSFPINLNKAPGKVDDVDALMDRLEESFDARFAALSKDITKAAKQLSNIAKTNGYPEVTADEYSASKSLSLPRITPQIGTLIGILNQFDDYVRLVDSLWIHGYLKRSQRTQLIGKFRKDIVKLVRLFMHLYRETDKFTRGTQGEGPSVFATLFNPVSDENLPDRLSDEDEAAAQKISGEVLDKVEDAVAS